MTIRSNEAHLIISAASHEQFPDTEQKELVFVGKSNVGKSSIINSLSNRKKLAYVGQTPGKTRLANFYHINDELLFVDVPGYGFANRSKQEQVQYAKLMDDYFSERRISLMLILVDIRRGISEEDETMIDFARFHQVPHAVVLSKSDKLSRSKAKQLAINTNNKYEVDVLLFSDKSVEQRDLIAEYILNTIAD